MTLPDIDLVISFRVPKPQHREQAAKAEHQYALLLETLQKAGLRSTGRRGQSQEQILTLVSCPQPLVDRLVRREL
jgi:anoctamin-10